MERTPERELMPMAQPLNIGFTAGYGPSRAGVASLLRGSGIPTRRPQAHPIARQSCQLRLGAFTRPVKLLDDASRIDLGFPQELYAKEFPRALRYGGMRDQIAS